MECNQRWSSFLWQKENNMKILWLLTSSLGFYNRKWEWSNMSTLRCRVCDWRRQHLGQLLETCQSCNDWMGFRKQMTLETFLNKEEKAKAIPRWNWDNSSWKSNLHQRFMREFDSSWRWYQNIHIPEICRWA